MNTIDDWVQFAPKIGVVDWSIYNHQLMMSTVAEPTANRRIYLKNSTIFMSDSSTTVSIDVLATQGEVGVGLRHAIHF